MVKVGKWRRRGHVLLSTRYGMPMKMTQLTKPRRIIGFLRMLRIETVTSQVSFFLSSTYAARGTMSTHIYSSP